MTIRLLIVDDREDVREGLRETISLAPEGGELEFELEFPFDSVDDYAPYIVENEIDVLVLDERLSEQANRQSGRHVSYLGHDVLDGLRARLPDFPVYVVTTYPHDTDLVSNSSEVEDVIDRTDFNRSTEKYVSRIQRAASRYLQSKRVALGSLDRLSIKAARGELDESEEGELASVRAYLSLPYEQGSASSLSSLVEETRALASEAEMLLRELKDRGRA